MDDLANKVRFTWRLTPVIFLLFRYTRQVIDETLRASVLGPWGARVHDFDLQVGEYVIPKEVCTTPESSTYPVSIFTVLAYVPSRR